MILAPDSIDRLSEIPVGARPEAILDAHPNLRDRRVILELADAVNRAARVDVGRAERIADIVAWLSELTADDFCRARALRCCGNVQVIRSNYRQAVRFFEDSLKIIKELGVEVEEAAGLSSLIQPLIYLGDYEDAFARAQSAKDIAIRLKDELLSARLDINFGNILHRQDRFQEAIENYQAARGTLRKLGQLRDCAIASLNLAVCYIALNDFKAAEEAYRQARALSETENMPAITAQADYNIAYLHYYRGEYSSAIELYQKTRQHCQHTGDSFHEALCDLDQAELYLELHLHEEASALAKQARAAFGDLNMPYEAAKATVWLAVAAYQDRRMFRALELLAEARQQMEREGNTIWTAILDLYQALAMQQEGRYCEALRFCKTAQLACTVHTFKSVHIGLVRANLELDLGHAADARLRIERALADAETLQSPHLLFHAHKILGRCHEVQNQIAEAMTSYQRSLQWLEQIPVQALTEGFKVPLVKNKFEVYEALLSLGLSSCSGMSAASLLELVEKSRSREIADLLSFRANALKPSSLNKSVLVEHLNGLREELSWYHRQSQNAELASSAESAAQATQMRSMIRVREQSLLQTLDTMRETAAEFHSLQTAGSVSIDKARECLMSDELLLTFFEARGVIYAGLLTDVTCEIVPVTRASFLREHLRWLQGHFAHIRAEGHEWVTNDPRALDKVLSTFRALHDALIAPIRTALGQRRLIIAPEGVLRYLPFHALFDGSQFLSDQYVLSYVGSASVLYLAVRKTPIRHGTDVLLGTCLDRCKDSPRMRSFSRVSDPGQLLGLNETRFIHLDCRLSLRLDNPLLSTVTIGAQERTVLDLFNLQSPCSVMSVTGIGPGVRADGNGKELEILARAFEYAGARTLLLPLWASPRNSTEFFLESFYEELSTEPDVPIAFQKTLAQVRKKYFNPFDWAPFIVRGQTGRQQGCSRLTHAAGTMKGLNHASPE